ncbi:DUF2975 domain-containing protein [Paludicola sp. MB14-C6]|uniref:DUF2975 domain-containing protein n=1 Tax=Paludihabitans sp. MB14-C6 TaxID=3070656 RepID=UPI0027DC779E|nr:DUF2975 domain-containing protein [Paludicola sp. MB14-C6]WMJ24065.1 DUF2975 domain-containing protein [Paludicola sp. MB14-C6]
MEKKLAKMQSTCKWMHTVIGAFFILYVILAIALFVYLILNIITPSGDAFVVSKASNGWSIWNNNYSFGFSPTIGYDILNPTAQFSNQAKPVLIVTMIVYLCLRMLPMAIIIKLTKDTFYNMAFGKSPFSLESVRNLRKTAIIQMISENFYMATLSLALSYILDKQFSINFSFDLVSIFIGLLILAIAYIFDYVCELQKEHEETL